MSATVESLLHPALRELLAREKNWANLIRVAKWLKGARRFRQLALFTERLIRRRSMGDAPTAWHLHCQGLVELGLLTTAESLLDDKAEEIAALKPAFDRVAIDLLALRGRIAKQRYFDLAGQARDDRKSLLAASAAHYESAVKRAGNQDALRYFPAVNLVALAKVGEDNQWDLNIVGSSKDIAQSVIQNLKTTEAAERAKYSWWNATWAECQFALGDFKLFSDAVEELVTAKKEPKEFEDEQRQWKTVMPFESEPEVSEYQADAFTLASFIRQLNEVWNIQECADPRVKEAMYKLDQALMKREGGSIEIDAAKVKAYEGLEAVLGAGGIVTYQWIKDGIETAKSVASVIMKRQSVWKRIGTAFCVAVKDAQGYYALTNAHVISDKEQQQNGFPAATSAAEIRLRFEAIEGAPEVEVESIVWCSPIEEHDATLLSLKTIPAGVRPLHSTRKIPSLANSSRVYVIGYPRGDVLSMSMQDNELLDHQGRKNPPPTQPQPVLVHYRAPTEEGSSGSPVFDDSNWYVMALHHKTREQSGAGITLSGQKRYPRANEGISMESISWALNGKCKLDFAE